MPKVNIWVNGSFFGTAPSISDASARAERIMNPAFIAKHLEAGESVSLEMEMSVSEVDAD